jgi:type VI secretion system protein ImpK
MANPTYDLAQGTAGWTGHRRGQLALVLQEAFTAAVRVRADRQVAADANAFRTHVKQMLAVADQEARRLGYTSGDVKSAVYAYIVFLDEAVLNSTQPMFADWPRKPLQEEIFGGHMGGEVFFKNLQELLERQDADDLADVLEVYQLCLLLGFQGRHSLGGQGELRGLLESVSQKLLRIRGGFRELSPAWAPPKDEKIPTPKDKWLRIIAIAGVSIFALAVVLFLVFTLSLGSGVSTFAELRATVLS